MRYFDAKTTAELLDYPRLIKSLREAHKHGTMPQTQCNIITDTKRQDNQFITQFSWASDDVIAIKLNSIFPLNANLSPPLPSIQGVVILFEARHGQALACCDGAELTFRKTAADSALGADFLSNPDAKTLLLMGAGGLAPHIIAAMRFVRPSINKILIWNRHHLKAQQLAEKLTSSPCPVLAVSQLDEAVPQADIISCITMATTPILQGALLQQGCHVDLIGAYQPQMREANDDVIRRAGRLFVDSFANCESSGDVADPLKNGILSRDQIVADLFSLCKGQHHGRADKTEITVYKNVGGGHLDMFAMKQLLTIAEI